MRSELSEIQEAFQRAGWSDIPLRGPGALQATFKSSYATAGILVADGVDEVLKNWEDAQETLRELRSSDATLRDHDAYLVILIPRVDAQADSLREVMNNTYVCRKVCVEVDGRTIKEALEELPFFCVDTSGEGATIEEEIGTSSKDLPELPLEDLRKASAEVVLDGLLQGRYGRWSR